jgi:hypothetical protein
MLTEIGMRAYLPNFTRETFILSMKFNTKQEVPIEIPNQWAQPRRINTNTNHGASQITS